MRALNVLRDADQVVCEERKVGTRLLKQYDLQRELWTLNEHNEAEQIPAILSLLRAGRSVAVFSDAGTPVFADPGARLVQAAIAAEIEVVAVPGASSLMAALVSSGLRCDDFHYVGFLPRKTEERRERLRELSHLRTTLIIYEAPYRLLPLLKDAANTLNLRSPASLCIRLTQSDERVLRGTLQQIYRSCENSPFKSEFVLLVDNRGGSSRRRRGG